MWSDLPFINLSRGEISWDLKKRFEREMNTSMGQIASWGSVNRYEELKL